MAASWLDTGGWVLLHRGSHTTASSGAVPLEYVLAGTLLVVSIGVALYWYYGAPAESR